jgi:hypothetical protein
MNKVLFSKYFRKIKYAIFIPKRVTTNPGDSTAMTSDLFPIMRGVGWNTYFELLDLPSLIRGNYLVGKNHSATFYFFDELGNELGNTSISSRESPRYTLNINKIIMEKFPNAATFSVFHQGIDLPYEFSNSLAAERGYTGYHYSNLPAKGYIHGNLDAIALTSKGLRLIGNQGLISRKFNLQHLLRGKAKYILVFTNPTPKKTRYSPR